MPGQFVSQGSHLLALLTTLENTNPLGYRILVNVNITRAYLQLPFWSSAVQTDSKNGQPLMIHFFNLVFHDNSKKHYDQDCPSFLFPQFFGKLREHLKYQTFA